MFLIAIELIQPIQIMYNEHNIDVVIIFLCTMTRVSWFEEPASEGTTAWIATNVTCIRRISCRTSFGVPICISFLQTNVFGYFHVRQWFHLNPRDRKRREAVRLKIKARRTFEIIMMCTNYYFNTTHVIMYVSRDYRVR